MPHPGMRRSLLVVLVLAIGLMAGSSVAARAQAANPVTGAKVQELLSRGLQATQVGRLRDAETAFRQALKLDPRNRDARYNLALVYYSGGDYARAETQFASVLSLDPSALDARVGLGLSQYAQRKYSAAIPNLRSYVTQRPADTAALLSIARCYLALKRPAEALPYLRSAAALLPQDPSAAFELGKAELAAGNYTRARAALSHALTLKPDSAQTAAQLGRACLAARDYQSALRVLEPLAAFPAPPPEGLKALAATYDALDRPEDALRVRSDLAAVLPPGEAVPLRLKLGQIHADAERWPQAYEQFRAAVSAAPHNLKAVASLAGAATALGSREEAAGWWQEATRIAPTNPATWLGLCGALLARPDPAGALQAAAQAVKLDGTNLTALRTAAEAARLAGDLSAAETYLRRILARDPSDAAVRAAVVEALEQRGQLPRALLEAAEALRGPSPQPEALLKVADLAERLGNLDVAMAQHRRLLEAGGRYEIPAALELGRLLVQADRAPEALVLYRMELSKHPGSPPLSLALARAYQEAGHDQAAAEVLTGLLAANSELTPARVSLAESLAWLGRHDEARQHIAAVLADPPVTEEALRVAVTVYERAGRLIEVVPIICRMLPDDAPDRPAAELIAGIYRTLGRPADGAALLSEEYEAHPDHHVLGLEAGRLWAESGDLARAQTTLEGVAAQSDWRDAALTALALGSLKANMPLRALQTTRMWLEGDLAAVGVMTALAELDLRPDLVGEFAPLLTRLLDSHHGSPAFWEAAVALIRYCGRSGTELSRLEAAFAEAPSDPGLATAVALLALDAGRPQVAQRAVDSLAAAWDCDRAVASALSHAYAAQGRTAEALSALQAHADRGAASAEDYAWLGGLLAGQGQARQACWRFCQCLRKDITSAAGLAGIRSLIGSRSVPPAAALEGIQYVFFVHPEAQVLFDLARELALQPGARDLCKQWLDLYDEPLSPTTPLP